MNREEMVEKFHESMKNQVLKEFQRNGTIKPKAILLLLDYNEKPVLTYKTLPNILDEEDEVFTERYLYAKKEIEKLIRGVKGDGYDVLSLMHIEYCDDDERLYTSLKKGENLKETEIFEYSLINDFSTVNPDGSIQTQKPKLELIQTNW